MPPGELVAAHPQLWFRIAYIPHTPNPLMSLRAAEFIHVLSNLVNALY